MCFNRIPRVQDALLKHLGRVARWAAADTIDTSAVDQ